MRQRVIRTLSVTILCLMLFANAWGCSKRVASSSGEATSTTKRESTAPVETIKPESMATIPDDRRSTTETARAPLEVPLSSSERVETPSLKSPSSLAATIEGPSLGDIFFDFDRYTIRRDAQPVLEGDAV